MESFIRSKYESRRWALEGPPPRDPSVLENAREVGLSPENLLTVYWLILITSQRSSELPQPAPQPQASPLPVTAPSQPTPRQSRSLLSTQTGSKLPPPQAQR